MKALNAIKALANAFVIFNTKRLVEAVVERKERLIVEEDILSQRTPCMGLISA